jgi:predicted transcriptional regulator
MRAHWRRDDLQVAIAGRGVTGAEFARLAGIRPETLKRALGGRATNPETTKRIITLLARLPELEGAQLIESAQTKKAIPPRTALKEAVGVGDELQPTG